MKRNLVALSFLGVFFLIVVIFPAGCSKGGSNPANPSEGVTTLTTSTNQDVLDAFKRHIQAMGDNPLNGPYGYPYGGASIKRRFYVRPGKVFSSLDTTGLEPYEGITEAILVTTYDESTDLNYIEIWIALWGSTDAHWVWQHNDAHITDGIDIDVFRIDEPGPNYHWYAALLNYDSIVIFEFTWEFPFLHHCSTIDLGDCAARANAVVLDEFDNVYYYVSDYSNGQVHIYYDKILLDDDIYHVTDLDDSDWPTEVNDPVMRLAWGVDAISDPFDDDPDYDKHYLALTTNGTTGAINLIGVVYDCSHLPNDDPIFDGTIDGPYVRYSVHYKREIQYGGIFADYWKYTEDNPADLVQDRWPFYPNLKQVSIVETPSPDDSPPEIVYRRIQLAAAYAGEGCSRLQAYWIDINADGFIGNDLAFEDCIDDVMYPGPLDMGLKKDDKVSRWWLPVTAVSGQTYYFEGNPGLTVFGWFTINGGYKFWDFFLDRTFIPGQ